MLDYYVLDWDASLVVVGQVQDSNDPSAASKYTRGVAFGSDEMPQDLRIYIEVMPEKALPDYFTLDHIPVASERFVKALRTAADNFEAYPAPVVYEGRTVATAFVLNVVGNVNCLDMKASDVTFIDEDSELILRMKRLAIDSSRTAGLDLFRLSDFEVLLLASERVRAAIEGFSGVTLALAEGWSDSAWY